jgi:hypothetical protein
MGARSSWHLIFSSSDRGLTPQSSPSLLTAEGPSPATCGLSRSEESVRITQFILLRTAACDYTCESRGNAGLREATAAPQRRFPKTFPSDQRVDPNPVALRGLALPESGAGDGNRTHTGGDSNPRKQAVLCDGGCQV